MNLEQLEYAISQYVDGTLSPLEHAALEQRFKEDAHARALLAAHQSVSSMLAVALPEPPAIDDAQLTRALCAAVAQTPPPSTRRFPIHGKSMRLSPGTWPARLAIAAPNLLVGFLGYQVYQLSPSGAGNPSTPASGGAVANLQAITDIAVMTARVPAGPSVQQITIGPSPAIAGVPAVARYEDLGASRPGKVVIATSEPAASGSGLPY